MNFARWRWRRRWFWGLYTISALGGGGGGTGVFVQLEVNGGGGGGGGGGMLGGETSPDPFPTHSRLSGSRLASETNGVSIVDDNGDLGGVAAGVINCTSSAATIDFNGNGNCNASIFTRTKPSRFLSPFSTSTT